jgi:hypothetical protein
MLPIFAVEHCHGAAMPRTCHNESTACLGDAALAVREKVAATPFGPDATSSCTLCSACVRPALLASMT